jgi:hypothetical protein
MTKRREGHNARNQAGLKATSGAREGFIVLFEKDHAETRRCVLARGEETASNKGQRRTGNPISPRRRAQASFRGIRCLGKFGILQLRLAFLVRSLTDGQIRSSNFVSITA